MKRCGTRAFTRMGGWSEEDMRKPLIMVAAPYTNASSCNHHFDQLAKHISDAVEAAGGSGTRRAKIFKSSAHVVGCVAAA